MEATRTINAAHYHTRAAHLYAKLAFGEFIEASNMMDRMGLMTIPLAEALHAVRDAVADVTLLLGDFDQTMHEAWLDAGEAEGWVPYTHGLRG